MLRTTVSAALIAVAVLVPVGAMAGSVEVRPAEARFAPDVDRIEEVPDFQRHVLPVLGRLGCNGRACHGSFQGQGGFRLSLFGYDFQADYDALLLKDAGRVDKEDPQGSKILQKPTMAIPHKGGKRLEADSWAYHLIEKWIDAGAPPKKDDAAKFDRLEVTPSEILFKAPGETVQLRVVAHWSDGTHEDVTCLSRFRTNDEGIAEISEAGVVKSLGKGDTAIVAFYDNGVGVTQVLLPMSERIGPDYPETPTPTRVDALVVEKLRKLGIVPADVCTDAEFLRRVSLDLTGTLPVPSEIEEFLSDPAPDKRAKKIDELLERPTYAAYWANKLGDLTGNSARNLNGQTSNVEMSRDWARWLTKRIGENVAYDKIIEGIVLATSRAPGQSYEDYVKQQSSYYRTKDPADFAERETMPYYWSRRIAANPADKALNFSYAFLGVRLECAQCHKHPFDQWTQSDFNQFTAFFSGVRTGIQQPDARHAREMEKELGLDKLMGGNKNRALQELVREGKTIPWPEVYIAPTAKRPNAKETKSNAKKGDRRSTRIPTARVLGGDSVGLDEYEDPRQPLMDWLRGDDNPYFARAFVNRVWANHFGVGIVNPPDDQNLANPPSNPALLEHLTRGFVTNKFDMKWLHREVLNSLAYQRSWKTNPTNRLDEKNFSRSLVRRLPAEVTFDAVNQATGNAKVLAAAFTSVDERAIGPMAGAPNNRRGGSEYAAKVFGKPTRDTNCDCNRTNDPNLLQAIYLQNDQELLSTIERRDGWVVEFNQSRNEQARKAGKGKTTGRTLDAETTDRLVRESYLRTLSRPPTDEEADIARASVVEADDAAKGLRDLVWALLNTKEFITNH